MGLHPTTVFATSSSGTSRRGATTGVTSSWRMEETDLGEA